MVEAPVLLDEEDDMLDGCGGFQCAATVCPE